MGEFREGSGDVDRQAFMLCVEALGWLDEVQVENQNTANPDFYVGMYISEAYECLTNLKKLLKSRGVGNG